MRPTTLDHWSEPVKLGVPVNSPFYEIQPYLSPDGKMLFFASNRPGGFGDFDLYMTTRSRLHD
jgi:Tol biopolymer transport system component